MRKLYTIGYEGRNIEEFISELIFHNITHLIDVRELPISRKKYFSKTPLKRRLNKENIEYIHIKPLGCPKEIRYKLKNDWDYDYFFDAYSDYLRENLEYVEEIMKYIAKGVVCLMCYERQPEKCHRIVIARSIKEKNRELNIVHI